MSEGTLGDRLRQLREARGASQDELAGAARFLNLKWTRSTVAKIEAGQRDLKASELFLLPVIFGKPIDAFIPDEDYTSLDGFKWESSKLRQIIRGKNVPGFYGYTRPERTDAPGEAEEKVARKLGVGIEQVSEWSLSLWDASLTNERERRLRAHQDLDGTGDRRRIQAIRGAITRGLIRELQDKQAGRQARAPKDKK